MTKPPENYVWMPGYMGVYNNPDNKLFHGRKMYVKHRDPLGLPGLECSIDRPDGNIVVAIDEDKLWFTGDDS
jgi:hypothetical protein